MLEQVQETAESVLIDGLWTDPETGEVLALERKPDFQVTDDESAEWVLERILNAEAEKARLEMKKRAIVENLDRQIAAAQRRIDGLHYRFDSDLEHYAMTALDGQSTKTLKLAYGTLSFRNVKGGLRLAEGADAKRLALDWAKHLGIKSAVVTKEEFQISKLDKDDAKRLQHLAEMGTRYVDLGSIQLAFQVKPDETKFTVKTGLGKDGDQ